MAEAPETPEQPEQPAQPVARRGLPRPGDAPATPETPPAPVRRGLPRADASAPAAEAAPAASAPAPSAAPTASAPRRFGRFTARQWVIVGVVGVLALTALAAVAVILVRALLQTEGMQEFLTRYPGEYELPESAPVGLPAWLGWQHFFNVFLMVLIIRSGLQVRRQAKPPALWSPRGNPSRKISINLWFHQALDILWLANGVIFVVLLFVTGQWMRIVPTSWEVFPNALSAGLQYVSLDWPTENGWVNYNSLQQLAYFATVFLAAPIAAISGYRMSGLWPKDAARLNRLYPAPWARAVHFPTMLYFVVFIVVHVTLVLSTGALRNLNHIYGTQDAVNWTGFALFTVSLVVIAAAVIAARPVLLAPIAKLFGSVTAR
jgi:thiosulfate reductase cytochrome b subunit